MKLSEYADHYRRDLVLQKAHVEGNDEWHIHGRGMTSYQHAHSGGETSHGHGVFNDVWIERDRWFAERYGR